MEKKKIIEEIENLLDNEQQHYHQLMNNFFNLLFWKDYQKGYVDAVDRLNMLEEIKNVGDTKKILPFINKIRKQIGLKELTAELDGILLEITPEVNKRLILKSLK